MLKGYVKKSTGSFNGSLDLTCDKDSKKSDLKQKEVDAKLIKFASAS